MEDLKNDFLYCKKFWTSLAELKNGRKQLTEFNYNGEKRPFKTDLEAFLTLELEIFDPKDITKEMIINKLPDLQKTYLSDKKVFRDNDAWKYADPRTLHADPYIKRTRRDKKTGNWITEVCTRGNLFVLRRHDFSMDMAGKKAFMVYYLILTLVGFPKDVKNIEINWTRRGKIANTKCPLIPLNDTTN